MLTYLNTMLSLHLLLLLFNITIETLNTFDNLLKGKNIFD